MEESVRSHLLAAVQPLLNSLNGEGYDGTDSLLFARPEQSPVDLSAEFL